MKPSPFVILMVSFYFLSFSLQAQEKWVTDTEMQFKIKVPSNYRQNQAFDGTDKVLTLMSPDENVMVRVRAMPATDQFTTEILQRVFEQNIIQGAQRIMNEDGDLHGIPARASAYTWKVDRDEAVLGTYYIVKNGFAYIIWTAVPRNLVSQRSAEADGIIDSFELLDPQSKNRGGGLLSSLANRKSSDKAEDQHEVTTTPIASSSKVAGYVELVSDDACVEHLFPVNYVKTSAEAGQSIWEDGSGVKMIVQTIFKQGTFESFMQSHTQSISEQGADVLKKQFTTVNGNRIYDYDYEYNSTLFNYVAVEGKDVFYLLGFVGDKLKQSRINKHAQIAQNSLKVLPCGKR
ncbi:hypothetical protein GM418_00545 [Maribellus comscasis]|uniref:DUF1795 domain-containing protein n=1 Tax=Maribellus comscasis TaxID=2681766 RepID=A0A6I6JH45_9BACT|nr:hypothetical protein [Maribellus comscasis]QGY42195.1 hypothetical protein GM418_00545 [Maribellus comscasis]